MLNVGERRHGRGFHLQQRANLDRIRRYLRAVTSQKERLIHFQVFFRRFYPSTVTTTDQASTKLKNLIFQMHYTDAPQAFEQTGVASI